MESPVIEQEDQALVCFPDRRAKTGELLRLGATVLRLPRPVLLAGLVDCLCTVLEFGETGGVISGTPAALRVQ